MIAFIKDWLKVNYISKSEDYDNKVERVVNAYFTSYLYYYKYNIRPLDVDSFCKEIEMNEEDIAKVHKAIKERKAQIRIERLEEDFN